MFAGYIYRDALPRLSHQHEPRPASRGVPRKYCTHGLHLRTSLRFVFQVDPVCPSSQLCPRNFQVPTRHSTVCQLNERISVFDGWSSLPHRLKSVCRQPSTVKQNVSQRQYGILTQIGSDRAAERHQLLQGGSPIDAFNHAQIALVSARSSFRVVVNASTTSQPLHSFKSLDNQSTSSDLTLLSSLCSLRSVSTRRKPKAGLALWGGRCPSAS